MFIALHVFVIFKFSYATWMRIIRGRGPRINARKKMLRDSLKVPENGVHSQDAAEGPPATENIFTKKVDLLARVSGETEVHAP